MDLPRVPVVDLDVREAPIELVGAKAAALARARHGGLPVLPGFVVPASAGHRLVERFVPLCSRSGPHAAALALMDAARSVDLSELVSRSRTLGHCLVARSSSVVEDDPVWSGAFSSFLDVAPGDMPTAVAGCWASVFTPTVLELCARTGTTPDAVCPAVLVQPMVEPQAGGAATIAATPVGEGSHGVDLVAVWGSPAPLLAGWCEGYAARVDGDVVTGPAVETGPVRHDAPGPLPSDWLREVARVARRAADGDPVAIEWAVADGRPVLFQVRPLRSRVRPKPQDTSALDGRPRRICAVAEGAACPSRSGDESGRSSRDQGETRVLYAAASPRAPALARAVVRYGGPLGDELVLPWILAANMGIDADEEREEDAPGSSEDIGACFDRAVNGARELATRALGRASAGGPRSVAALVERVAAGDLEVLAGLGSVPSAAQRRVLRDFGTTARHLVLAGALAHEEQLWALSVQEVPALLARPVPVTWHRHRYRTLRWQPLVQATIRRWGRIGRGQGGVSQRAAGFARRLESANDLRRVVPGDVVVVQRPVPQLAPALWVASGLVAESGSPAAHLLEVARSVRVPAVTGVGPLGAMEGGTLVLVDGDAGRVGILNGCGQC